MKTEMLSVCTDKLGIGDGPDDWLRSGYLISKKPHMTVESSDALSWILA
jgi:hypothetical protein